MRRKSMLLHVMDEEREQAIIMDEGREQSTIMDEEREQAIIYNG